MTKVNTVAGQVSANDLGVTLIHEHLAGGLAGWNSDSLAVPYELEAISKTCAEAVERTRVYGVKTIVDPSPSDMYRDVEIAKRVSDRTGMNIIVATGLYNELNGQSAYFKFRSLMYDVTSELCESFLKEITHGIGNSGVKAGVIKVATSQGNITDYEKLVLRAAARAQKETGVPIVTHTEGGTMGPEQAEILISEGANPRHIVIGHMCGNTDLRYHLAVLEKGVYIAFDRLGIDSLVPDTLRKACIIGLLGIGYADRIMLSHDYAVHFFGRSPGPLDMMKQMHPEWSYCHVFKNIIPALEHAGVSHNQINTMMVENPRRLFAKD